MNKSFFLLLSCIIVHDSVNAMALKKSNYRTPYTLHNAVIDDDPTLVEALILKGAKVNRQFWRQTALHYAAKTGNIDIVKKLVKAGANLEQEDYAGKKPIQHVQDTNLRNFLLNAETCINHAKQQAKREFKERLYVIALGTHERVGAESPLALLANDYILRDLFKLALQMTIDLAERNARQQYVETANIN